MRIDGIKVAEMNYNVRLTESYLRTAPPELETWVKRDLYRGVMDKFYEFLEQNGSDFFIAAPVIERHENRETQEVIFAGKADIFVYTQVSTG